MPEFAAAAPADGVTNGHAHPAGAVAPAPASKAVANGTRSTPALPGFAAIADVVEAFANGEFVIVLDSPSRENEGDLIIAASALTPSKASFLIRYTSGYLCAPMTNARADKLQLPLMVPSVAVTDPTRTAYTISVDAHHPQVTTGISSFDRAMTCRMLADDASDNLSFRSPGHILPLRAKDGGVRQRRGHTEATVDLARLAGLPEVGVIGEMILDGDYVEGKPEFENSGMMRRDDCLEFGRKWGIKVCTIEDLVEYVEAKDGVLNVPATDY